MYINIQKWAEISNRRRSTFNNVWDQVKHGSTGNDSNSIVNSVLMDNERLSNRSKMKKSNFEKRLGSGDEPIADMDPNQYDDTGLYQGLQY